jgi:succinoglycan biosynthesis transport protein ExoP
MAMNPLDSNAPSGGRQASLREFVAVLFRRRWLILGLFLVVTATVVVLSLTAPVTYTSSGRVLVYRGERQSALNATRMFYGDWESELGSEVARARSAAVIERTREVVRLNAEKAGRPVPDFDPAAADVEVMSRSDVLGIAYTDRDPAVAHEVCDALITAYLDIRQTTQIGRPESFFEAELQNLDAEISRRMREREQIGTSTGVTSTVEQSRAWGSQLAMMEQKRAEAAADMAEASSALKAMIELQENPDLDVASVESRFDRRTSLEALKTRIVDQQGRIASLRERYRDDAPEVQNAVSTLATLQALLRKEVEGGIQVARSRIDLHQARVDALDRDIADIRSRLGGIPSSQRRVEELEAELKTLRMRYDDYAKARDLARISSNTSQALNVVLLNPAGPGVPGNSRDWVRLALAPAFSLVVGIGLAFFIDGLDLTVRTAAQAEEYLEAPVLASLSERRRRRG